ncbi:MAG: hypothetical protein PHY45_05685 [Rhodocyclaceae bacterium]|nr:hypothetical protein [Rhodocyclaceae bacterium]
MDAYRHYVSGFFAHREEARNACSRLVERGLPRERLQMFAAESAPPIAAPEGDSSKVLTGVLKDAVIGTAVGTAVGALAEVALVAANVSLFVAGPLVAPLAMLGWGASVGGLMGAAAGAQGRAGSAKQQEGKLSALIQDAIFSGQVVVVAETGSERETAIAREVIQAAVGEYQDAKAA